MATIGTFKKIGQNVHRRDQHPFGPKPKNVRLAFEETRSNDNAPHYRVFAGKAEIGGRLGQDLHRRPRLPLPQTRRSLVRQPDLRQPLPGRERRGLQPHLVAVEQAGPHLTYRAGPARSRAGLSRPSHRPKAVLG